MNNTQGLKIERILAIYTRLISGCVVNKAEEAQYYGVHKRSIQRDIDDIRDFLESDSERSGYLNNIVYDRVRKGHRMEHIYDIKLTNSEVLAICKILLESRAFAKDDMEAILNKIISGCVPESEQKLVRDLISNEAFHYVQPHHKISFINMMWDISEAIHNNRYIEIEYARIKDKSLVTRRLRPAAVMFSEYYFYLTAFIENEDVRKNFKIEDDIFPTVYRMDRIKKLTVLDEQFYIPYRDRFEEGEFRKRIQFMYSGKLIKVTFKYYGMNIEAVLDRLPTAEILSEEDGTYTVSAEVFGDGIKMWILSQGPDIEVISPESLRQDIIQTLKTLQSIYS